MKKKKTDQAVTAYLAKIGRRGGQMRAAKYDKATLSEWAKKGGRPRKAKGD
jgi:general stress protein YciG